MTRWLAILMVGCVTDTPDIRPETSPDQSPAARPVDLPPPGGAPPTSLPTRATPVEVTIEQVRGTPVGTKVVVSGFLLAADAFQVDLSPDAAGQSVRLRCIGEGASALGPKPIDQAPLRATGTVARPDDDGTLVLTDCTATLAGQGPG